MNTMNVADVLNDDRQLKALIGLGQDQFEKLLNEFTSCLSEGQQKNCRKKLKKPRQRRPGGGRKPALGSPDHQLLFILILPEKLSDLRRAGLYFWDQSQLRMRVRPTFITHFKKAQENLQVLPKRTTDDPDELLQLIESVDHILIDTTERAIQRPQKPARQKEHYSGKKGYHTVKNTTISDTNKRILILGETAPGSHHDYTLLKEELDPKVDWFASTDASVDLGYQGIKTDYLSAEKIHIPHKKPRKSAKNPDPQLTRQQKRENRRIGRVRVLVEHAIGGMKIFRVLTIRLRNHLKHLADDFIFAAAGLWNLKNSFVVQ
jgi:hypothetical protein